MKAMVLKLFPGIMVGILISCGSQQKAATTEDIARLEKLANSRSFQLKARWANPLATQSINAIAAAGLLPPGSSPNRIDIMGTANFLKVKNDSVYAVLPYYGERQFGSAYNPQEVGIQFKGIAENYTMEYNEKKQQYNFEFDVINDQGEGFNVNGSLFPNLNTTFYINSTERMTIGYSGIVSPVDE